jgi:hypothetical protein
VTLGGLVVRGSVVAALLLLALVLGRGLPFVGFVVTFVALDAAVCWFGVDSRSTDERFPPGMPE